MNKNNSESEQSNNIGYDDIPFISPVKKTIPANVIVTDVVKKKHTINIENKVCLFCEETKRIEASPSGQEMYLYGKNTLVIEALGEQGMGTEKFEFEINNCPMCGKKLGKR